MDLVTDSETVKRMMIEKQALEVYLAFDLLEIFNDPGSGLIGPLRDMVMMAIHEMEWVRKYSTTLKNEFERKWSSGKGKWKGYAGVRENYIVAWDYDRIKMQVGQFKAEHCADWIRIFGEVIEDILAPHGHQTENLKRKSYQKGDKYHWEKFDGRPKAVKKNPVQPKAGRRRELAPEPESKDKKKWARSSPYIASKTTALEFLRQQPDAGMNRWDIKNNDTIGKMDKVFGLTPGATISGTTTDNIYFLNKFGRLNINPIFYLLPAATLVRGGHHTLLEVAYPLSINGLIDYSVGLYSTLLPTGAGTSRLPGKAGAGEIKGLLQLYENRWENNLFLAYYKGSRTLKGCVLFSHINEKHIWRQTAKANHHMLGLFKGMGAWPEYDDVRDLVYSMHTLPMMDS